MILKIVYNLVGCNNSIVVIYCLKKKNSFYQLVIFLNVLGVGMVYFFRKGYRIFIDLVNFVVGNI